LLGIIIFLKGLKKQLRSDAALDLIFRGALKNLDVILRIYMPDLEKFKTWNAPKAEKIK